MRGVVLLLALAGLIGAACSGEPVPENALSPDPAWLTQRPENAEAYADETLTQFRKLVEGDVWRTAAWNTSGTLEAVHQMTGLVFVLVPGTGPGGFMMGSPENEAGRDDDEKRHRVTGSLPANPWGLHEMHGNVWEWCQDWYEESYDLTPRDGTAHAGSGSGIRVYRGGGWSRDSRVCRSAYRGGCSAGSRIYNFGFRPASKVSGH